MAEKEINIKVNLETGRATTNLRTLQDNIKQTGSSANNASSGFSNLQKKIISLESALSLTSRAFGFLKNNLTSIVKLVGESSRVDALSASFNNLAGGSKKAKEELLKLQTATKGLISDLDLMQSRNQAVLLGLPTEGFDDLAEASLKLGRAMGIDAKQALDSLVIGLGRGSKLVLDNLGIVIKQEEAYRRLAEQLGKTTEELTNQEKQSAFLNAAMEKIREKAAELPTINENAAISFQRLQATVENLKTEFLKNLATSSATKQVFDELIETVNSISVENLIQSFNLLAKAFSFVVKGINFVITHIAKLEDNFKIIAARIDIFVIKIKSALGFVSSFGSVSLSTAERVRELGREIVILSTSGKKTEKTSQLLIKRLTELRKILNSNSEAAAAYGDIYNDLLKRVKDFNKKIKEQKTEQKKLTDQTNKTEEQFNKLLTKLKEVTSKTKELKTETKNKTVAFKEATDILEKNTRAVNDLKIETDELIDNSLSTVKLSQANNSLKNLKDTFSEIKDEVSKGKSETDDFFKNISDGAINASKNTLDLQKQFKQIGDNLLSDVFSSIASGGTKQEKLKGIGDAIGNALAESLKALDAAVPGLGSTLSAIAKPFAGKVGDLFVKAFGGNRDAQNRARKDIQKFFAEAFDASGLQVIIDDQISKLDFNFIDPDSFEIDKLNPQGIVEGFREFASLAPEVQSFFESVGNSFNELLGSTESIGAQIGAILVNNLGGDLFNLRLAILATGKSFEELKESAIDAALKGQISFLQAASALRDLGQLAEGGIPGQIGAITEAFEKMRQAGVFGGRTTIEALKAIAVEATEVGRETLPDAFSAVVDAGKATQEEVNQIMDALANAGINSVEQLANATDEQLVQALAELESEGFGFAETAKQQVDDLVNTLNNLPEEVESRVTVKVRTITEDDGAREILDSGVLGQGLR